MSGAATALRPPGGPGATARLAAAVLSEAPAAPASVAAIRERGAARFDATGWPTRKWEDWKYTDLRPLAADRFMPAALAPAVEVGERDLGPMRLPPEQAYEAVFVNGRLRAELSRLDGLPAGVTVGTLADAWEVSPDGAVAALGTIADAEAHPMVALNDALLIDGAFVHVPAGVTVDKPVQLLFFCGGGEKPTAAQVRTLIVAGPGAGVRVVETWESRRGDPSWSNAVTEVVVGEGATVGHHIWERLGHDAGHVGNVSARVAEGGRFDSATFWCGGKLVRNDIDVRFTGPGASCALNGLYLLGGSQHVDNHTVVHHQVPDCSSRELYKGVLADRAHGVFNGKVIVHQDAQRTDAEQANHNLLLSDRADIDTKPELEIYADDVKCAHGTTVGQLDAEALFYLRSRGLSAERARQVLTGAFATEVVDGVADELLREHIRMFTLVRLAVLQKTDPGADGDSA